MDIFQRAKQPYPHSKRELIHVGLTASVLLVLMLVGGLIIAGHSSPSLQKKDVQEAINDLTSYLQEMKLLSREAANAPLAANYKEKYLQQLHKNLKEVGDKFQQTPPDSSVSHQVKLIRHAANKADDLSGSFRRHNLSSNELTKLISRLDKLLKKVADTEQNL